VKAWGTLPARKWCLSALAAHHELQVVVSGRAYDYLNKVASEHLAVNKIWGCTLVYEDNELRKWRTVVQNVKGALTGLPKNARAYFDIAERFAPDVVISDFESWSYLFGRSHDLPVISIDNMQIINRCKHDPVLLAGLESDFPPYGGGGEGEDPRCIPLPHHHVLLPAGGQAKHLFAPANLAARDPGRTIRGGGASLVYQTSTSNSTLPEILKRSGRECRIYGVRRDIKQDVVEGNLRYRPFSEAGFIDDLRTAAGVVASAGFTLMGEAVYLRRPMLAVPIKGQFEQELNARYLEKLGYGQGASELTSEGLGQFIERIPDFERTLASYSQDGNKDLLTALDLTLAVANTARRQSHSEVVAPRSRHRCHLPTRRAGGFGPEGREPIGSAGRSHIRSSSSPARADPRRRRHRYQRASGRRGRPVRRQRRGRTLY
jgi:UDP:flavonoid glycosyltransferase YjiC (YdhE family)